MTSEEINSLLNEARKQICAKPEAEQIVVVKTRKGRICAFINQIFSFGTRDEDCFIQRIRAEENEEIEAIVCMWGTGELDIPSMNLRNGLLSLIPTNESSLIILQAENGVCLKTLMECMPA